MVADPACRRRVYTPAASPVVATARRAPAAGRAATCWRTTWPRALSRVACTAVASATAGMAMVKLSRAGLGYTATSAALRLGAVARAVAGRKSSV
nr:hypothetical protein [Tanacetum cinerariifolium]